MDVIHVPIKHGPPLAARRYAPMVGTSNNDIAGMNALTSQQEILMPETRPSFNVQIMVEIGAAIIIGTHPMSVATTLMTSSHCQREHLWHR